ncbi:type I-E CRISPR-associated protein Cas5/CasD [Streptomyces sp. V3I7]|uniref:type I-E CRISPR-associated protein Cas5/CasD n=1 Tax=Streptomyces sp. V3I7 TaxID=3042278 RepID=UPI002784A81B|nr:type I-E CRISPR-associated protein Cas5/CasD [Streptomyces sp. V3I7]MDQ0988815.1 CRISPR system Cascade subunit CasD [Streptomyces sp. V3I7]
MSDRAVLVLRLAAPLQSWGGPSRYNRRDTRAQPTKSGILGLLSAAQGRPRETDLTDLLGLRLGVRVDQPGTLLRDYHTVSDHRGLLLPAARVDAKGVQKKNSAGKYTGVTWRYYLQDAVFTAVLHGPAPLLEDLDHALRQPVFPLSLGRRSCPPTGPISLGLRPDTDLQTALSDEPWQASEHHRTRHRGPTVTLEATVEDPTGDLRISDVPDTYDLKAGTVFRERTVRHLWVTLPTGHPQDRRADNAAHSADPGHDPFALLGW